MKIRPTVIQFDTYTCRILIFRKDHACSFLIEANFHHMYFRNPTLKLTKSTGKPGKPHQWNFWLFFSETSKRLLLRDIHFFTQLQVWSYLKNR